MPKVRFSPLVESIQGTMYGVVFKKSPNGNTIVTKKPDMSKVEWSEAQATQRQRFKRANAYAQAALADPKIRAKYERRAKRLHKRACDVAKSDYFAGKDLLSKK